MISIVLDSNIIIAAFSTRGFCNALFELCLDRFEIVIGENILNEITNIFKNKLKVPSEKISEITNFLREFCHVQNYEKLKEKICRDPSDDEILALAHSNKVDYIITGDKDLLILKSFNNVKIISPRQLWELARKTHFYE